MLKSLYDCTLGVLLSHIFPKTVKFTATLLGTTDTIRGKVSYAGLFDAGKMRDYVRKTLGQQGCGIVQDISFDH